MASTQHCTRVSSQCNKAGQETKNLDRRGRSCRDQQRRMLMESTVTLLEETARSASLQGPEQCSKSMVFLYTSKNNREHFYIPLAVTSKNIK